MRSNWTAISPPRRATALGAVIVLTAAGGLWLTARRVAPARLPELPIAPEVQVKFEHISLRGRSEGNRRWELVAKSIELTRDQSQTRLEGLRRATLYADDKPQLSAAAAWARLESPSRNMELGGGVEVRSPKGLVLRTQSLRWQADQERLDSTSPVSVTLRLSDRPGSAAANAGAGDTKVEAPHVTYLARSERIICDGGVKITQGGDRLSGDRLTADLVAQTLEIAGAVRMRAQVSEDQAAPESAGPLQAMKGLLESAPTGRH